jgi:L-ascorbate metabolism protein UlaG (beta-lactamase superfamily)
LKVKWLGHASFEIETHGSVIHIDPYVRAGDAKKADIILVTHDHFDHCDDESLRKISKPDTLIVSPHTASKKISLKARVVSVGDMLTHKGINVRVVPAYLSGSEHHPKGHGVGYVIDAGESRVYHAGDTGHIPEMALIEEVTVALLPVGGPHTMTVDDAVRAAQMLGAEIVVPMHYGHFKDSNADISRLKHLIESSSNARVEDLTQHELHI